MNDEARRSACLESRQHLPCGAIAATGVGSVREPMFTVNIAELCIGWASAGKDFGKSGDAGLAQSPWPGGGIGQQCDYDVIFDRSRPFVDCRVKLSCGMRRYNIVV